MQNENIQSRLYCLLPSCALSLRGKIGRSSEKCTAKRFAQTVIYLLSHPCLQEIERHMGCEVFIMSRAGLLVFKKLHFTNFELIC